MLRHISHLTFRLLRRLRSVPAPAGEEGVEATSIFAVNRSASRSSERRAVAEVFSHRLNCPTFVTRVGQLARPGRRSARRDGLRGPGSTVRAGADSRRLAPTDVGSRGVGMYAYIATFNGNPGSISRVRRVESGNPPPRLEGARMLMLVNLENGKSLGVRLFRERRA